MADVRMTTRIVVDVEPSRETEPAKNEFVADDGDVTSGILAQRRPTRTGRVWFVMMLCLVKEWNPMEYC